MRVLIALMCVALLSGCGAIEDTPTVARQDLVTFARTLPTPAGLDQSTDVVRASAADIQLVFAQGARDAAAAANYTAIGFADAAIRRWHGPAGATFTLVASRWGDTQTATNVGGGAAERIPFSQGASAWTPSQIPGARGSRLSGPTRQASTLSATVGAVSLFVITTGPVSDAAIVRTMDLAARALNR